MRAKAAHYKIGETITIEVVCVNHLGETIDLTGCTLTFKASDPSSTFSITKTNGQMDLSGEDVGEVIIKVLDSDTAALVVPVNLWWDLTLIDLLGDTYVVAEGVLALSLPSSLI